MVTSKVVEGMKRVSGGVTGRLKGKPEDNPRESEKRIHILGERPCASVILFSLLAWRRGGKGGKKGLPSTVHTWMRRLGPGLGLGEKRVQQEEDGA